MTAATELLSAQSDHDHLVTGGQPQESVSSPLHSSPQLLALDDGSEPGVSPGLSDGANTEALEEKSLGAARDPIWQMIGAIVALVSFLWQMLDFIITHLSLVWQRVGVVAGKVMRIVVTAAILLVGQCVGFPFDPATLPVTPTVVIPEATSTPNPILEPATGPSPTPEPPTSTPVPPTSIPGSVLPPRGSSSRHRG